MCPAGSPLPDSRPAGRRRATRVLIGFFAAALLAAAGLAADLAIPPRQYYPVATFSARFRSGPQGLELLSGADAGGDAAPSGAPVAPTDLLIAVEARVERPVVLESRGIGGWRAYDRNSNQPSPGAIGAAGPELTVRVRLHASRARPPATMHWPAPTQREVTKFAEHGLSAAVFPDEDAHRVLDAFGAAVLAQSGNAEYARLVRQGGCDGPRLSILEQATPRRFAPLVLPVAAGVVWMLLCTIAALRRAAARRDPAAPTK